MRLPELDRRLKMAAEMVRPGVVAADIGSDHAYLPVYLVSRGLCPRVIAADLREKPLQNARLHVEKYGLAGKIELRLSDGLSRFAPGDAEDFIFAGMGGTLMAELLGRAPWLRDPAKRLILQPMTHAEDLRRFLTESGFAILREDACRDSGRIYIAMCAEYTGEITERGPAYVYTGELPRCGNEPALAYLSRVERQLRIRAEGLRKSGRNPEELAALELALEDFAL